MRLVLKAALAAAAFSILPWMNCAIAASKPRPLFASDDVLSLTLKAALKDIPRNRGANPVPGVLTVGGAAPEIAARRALGARHHAAHDTDLSFPTSTRRVHTKARGDLSL